MKKKALNMLFLAAVFALTLWSVFKGEDIGKIFGFLKRAKPEYIVCSAFCVISFILCESVIIYYLMKKLSIRTLFSHCCLYSFVGFFYSCITPSASGGQPMQVLTMKKDEIPVAVSTVVLAIVAIMYKMVLVVIGAAVMFLRPQGLMEHLEPVKGVMYVGIGLNVACVAALLLLVFHPRLVRRASEWALGVINRIRPLKNPRKIADSLDKIVAQYHGAADFFRSNGMVVLGVFGITLVQRVLLFMVTWLTYKAFGLSGCQMSVIMSLQAMISLAVDMLPLPGGMGASENLFLEIFHNIFGAEFVLPGMMVSRGLSFYIQLIISAIMTLIAAFAIKEKTRSRMENRI